MIEELLREYTISELRALAIELENKCEGKQSELQLMVGSKYHDFIQSADHISKMREKSDLVEKQLPGFGSFCQNVVTKAKNLVEHSSPDNEISGYQSTHTVLAKAQVWKKCTQSPLWQIKLNENESSEPTFFLLLPAQCFTTAARHLGYYRRSECLSAIFLRQTILDDCKMILLEGSATPAEKTKAVAVLSLLETTAVRDGGELGPAVLAAMTEASVKLVLTNASRQLQLAAAGLGGPGISVAETGAALLGTVRVLQLALLDVFTILLPHSSPDGSGYLPTPFTTNVAEFVRGIEEAVGLPARPLPSRLALEAQQLRRTVGEWMSSISRVLSQLCVSALEQLMDHQDARDAGPVAAARLQQLVWRACCTPFAAGIGNGSEPVGVRTGMGHYGPGNWEAACAALLRDEFQSTRTRRQRDGGQEAERSVSGETASTSLWTAVFRNPFLQQVQRLLGYSRASVLRHVQSAIIGALAAGGLAVTLPSDDSTVASNGDEMGRSRAILIDVSPTKNRRSEVLGWDQDHAVPSSQLFLRAETVRRELEQRILEMIADVASPSGATNRAQDADMEADPLVSQSFSRTAVSQCSVLLGQVLSLLRLLVLALRTALEGAVAQDKPVVLSGLLFVNRVCWLLQIRGRFIEDILDDETLHPKSLGGIWVSEEQLRSAFEIVDTDGDDVVTDSEALEAFQAISFGNEKIYAEVLDILRHHSSCAASLSFAEFALLCSSATALSPARSRSLVFEAADAIVGHSLLVWAEGIVGLTAAGLRVDLLADYGWDASGATLSKSLSAPFRDSWIPLTSDAEDADSSTDAPTRISPALQAALVKMQTHIATSLVSADTVQCLPPQSYAYSGGIMSSAGTSSTVTTAASLAQRAETTLTYSLARAVGSTYWELLQWCRQSSTGLGPEKRETQLLVEQMALQALLDLECFRDVRDHIRIMERELSQGALPLGAPSRSVGPGPVMGFAAVQEAWMDCADAVDYQLLSDGVRARALALYRRFRLLALSVAAATESGPEGGQTGLLDTSAPPMSSASASSQSSLPTESWALPAVTPTHRFALLPLPFGVQSSAPFESRSSTLDSTHPAGPTANPASTKASAPRHLAMPAVASLGAIGIGGLEGIRSNLSTFSGTMGGLGGSLGGSLGLGAFLGTAQQPAASPPS